MTPKTPPSLAEFEEIQGLRHDITDLFQVFDTTLDEPEREYVRFRGRFLQDPADCFDELRERFERHGYTPTIKTQNDMVALIGMPFIFNPEESNRQINMLLLVATILSTLFVGASYVAETTDELFMIWRGWPFSLSIMLILGAHEMGHYFAAKYHKVPVTLPYFIPMPMPGSFGTFGAFIRLKAPVKNVRALLDVGAAGPWAGILFAIPILFLGLATSKVQPLPVATAYQMEGNSLLYVAMKFIVFGRFLPADGMDVYLNQVAWAGWVGLLVTSLNLIPVGQLDGGHTAFALLGNWAKHLFWPVIIALSLLVILTGTFTWVLWIGLLFLLGRRYAVPLDEVTTLDPRRKVFAVLTLLLFILVFIPIPLQYIY